MIPLQHDTRPVKCDVCGKLVLIYSIQRHGDTLYCSGPAYFVEHGCAGSHQPIVKARADAYFKVEERK
jgi:hypothetical protein